MQVEKTLVPSLVLESYFQTKGFLFSVPDQCFVKCVRLSIVDLSVCTDIIKIMRDNDVAFSGTVAYNITGWLFKNKDPLNECVSTLMSSSHEKMVASFFPPPDDGGGEQLRALSSDMLFPAKLCFRNQQHKPT